MIEKTSGRQSLWKGVIIDLFFLLFFFLVLPLGVKTAGRRFRLHFFLFQLLESIFYFLLLLLINLVIFFLLVFNVHLVEIVVIFFLWNLFFRSFLAPISLPAGLRTLGFRGRLWILFFLQVKLRNLDSLGTWKEGMKLGIMLLFKIEPNVHCHPCRHENYL